MADSDNDDNTEMRCLKCGYQWEYSGDLWHTTCPRCNLKTMTPLNTDYPDGTASASTS